MTKKEKKKREKKFERGFLLFFTFFQGLFLAFLVFAGVYETKILPEIRGRDQQIFMLKHYIQHMNNHQKEQSSTKKRSSVACLEM